MNEIILKKYPIYGPPCNKYWTINQIKNKTFNKKYSRHVSDEMEYQSHKEWTCEFFNSIEDYIRVMCLDPFEPYLLIKNRFPYKIPPNMKHYLLWMKPGFNLFHDHINTVLQKRFANCQIIWWQNDVSSRSILTVTHYQVFIYFFHVFFHGFFMFFYVFFHVYMLFLLYLNSITY